MFIILWDIKVSLVTFSDDLQLQCISRIARSNVMISKTVFFFDEVRTVRSTHKVSFIFVQLVSLETCHFSFSNASFKSTQLRIATFTLSRDSKPIL